MKPNYRPLRPRFVCFVLSGLLLVFWLAARPNQVEAEQPLPVVVILNSYHQGESWSDNQITGVVTTLQGRYPDLVPAIEHLDTKRFPEPEHLQRMRQYLADKYRGRKVDLLIVLDNPALDLALAAGEELFPGAALVFAGINGFEPETIVGHKGVTGVTENQNFSGTLSLALTLHPDARQVLVIQDYTTSGLAVRREVEASLPEFEDRVKITFSPDVPFEALGRILAQLAPDTVVLIMTYVTDAEGRTFTRAESTRLISSLSRAPVYAMHETRLGYGIVGGMLLEGQEHGRQAGGLALKILAGAAPARLPVEKSHSRAVLDYRELTRFQVPESRWPAGVIIINRPISWWEQYQTILRPALGTIGLLALLVALLTGALVRMRRAQAAQRESETRHLATLLSVGDGVVATDARGRVELLNPVAETLTGWQYKEARGQPLAEVFCIVNEETRQPVESPVARVLREGQVVGLANHTLLLAKDGQEYPIADSAAPIRDNKGVLRGVVLVFRDQTRERAAQQALLTERMILQDILEATLAGYWDWDITAGTEFLSPTFKKMFGYEDDELPNLPETWQKLIFAEDLPGVLELFNKHVQSHGKVPYYNEVRYRHKNGSAVWVICAGRVIEWTAEGEPKRMVGCHIDITHRKRAEEEKEKLQAQLLQAQKVDALGQLASGIAHDFNNLLMPIGGYAELSMLELSPDSQLYADLAQIKAASERATHLTRQILAFSRKQVLEIKLIDLNQVISGFERMLRRLIGEDIELQVRLAANLPPIRADQGQLEQVLLNLAVNARDAMPAGGRLLIQTTGVELEKSREARHAGAQPGPYLLLAVSDTGHGMDAATQQHIFEPFFTTKPRGQGTGLGLATVFGIIKQHGGHIWVESELGQGTTFEIYLPVSQESGRPVENAVVAKPSNWRGSEIILLVEDDQAVRDLAYTILKRQGYTVLVAKNGKEALAILDRCDRPVHMLLTDVVMPEMSGGQLFSRVSGQFPTLKVLYMSGYPDDVIAHQGVLDKGLNFIQKPFSVQTLAARVREVLDRN